MWFIYNTANKTNSKFNLFMKYFLPKIFLNKNTFDNFQQKLNIQKRIDYYY